MKPAIPQTAVSPTRRFSLFGPFLLLAFSIALALAWSLWQGLAGSRVGRARLADQERLLQQAARAEANLRAILFELVDLAKTNDAAKAIVTKWQIAVQNPPAGAPAISAAPTAPVVQP